MNFEKNDNDQTIYSQAPGKYLVDDSIRQKIIYPWAPGSSTSMTSYGLNPDFVSVEDDLTNLKRPLSKDPFKKYLPNEKINNVPLYNKEGFFESETPSLINNKMDLKEFGINRFDFLFIDPQENCIEPFRRIGTNTVLETLDNHKTLC